MDYKEFVEHPDLSSLEKIAKWVDTAATAITDLLARAEAAEARAEKAEQEIKRLRDIMWEKGFVPFPPDD